MENQLADTLIPEKPKINYWMIVTIVVIIFLGFLGWLFLNRNVKKNLITNVTQTPTPSNSSSGQTVVLKTLNLYAQSLGDPTTEFFFTEDTSIYKVKSDGQIKKLTSLDNNITRILFLPDKSGFVVFTENEVETNRYEVVPWIYKEDTQAIKKLSYSLSYRDVEEMTSYELISTKENSSGSADILLDKLDGSAPIKIGFLKDKPLEKYTCEVGANCSEKFFPRQFISSFDGSFLLNSPPRGGGLGEPAIVVSRDGSKQYKIDFYWFVASAAWIDNNKLLTQDQKGAKVFTFNNDGTFQTMNLKVAIGEQFNQRTVSPNKKYIGVVTYNPQYEVSLFSVINFQKKSIELIKPGSIDPNSIQIIGWNNNSDKILYVVGDQVKIYDLVANKSRVAASLKNGPRFPPNIFELR